MTTSPPRSAPAPSSRLTVPTVPGRRLRVAHGEDSSAEHPPDTHIFVQSRRPVSMSSLLRLPAALARRVAVVVDTSAALVALPGRLVGLVASAEQALAAVHAAVARTDALLDRVDCVTGKADGVVQAASRAVTAAATVVEQAGAITASAAPLLEGYSGPLRRLEPTVRRIADTTDPHEIDALVTLIDRLPHLAEAMNDAIPLLGRIDQVGPDLNQLLETVSDLNRMVGRLPKVFRRRRDSAADET